MQEIALFISNHIILVSIWMLLIGMVIFITIQKWLSNVKNITCIRAVQLMNQENAKILDLRNYHEYCQGHIVDSINLSLEDIKSGNIGDFKNNKNISIIIVCTNEMVSNNASKYLVKNGFKYVYILKDGISGWIKNNLPLVQEK